MNLPLNGRIAIIDDKIEQAIPLMNVLSQKRYPYSYYSGEVQFLPDQNDISNDIRILFLDINLIDDQVREEKVLRGRLIPVLKRVISPSNYPYVVVYWSRTENELKKMVEDMFDQNLSDRKPIAYLSQNKLDFFNLDGSKTDEFDEKLTTLFSEIFELLGKLPSYNYLLNWENHVHCATDKTLQEIFKSCHTPESWSDNAGFLIDKLGLSYTGKNSYKNFSAEQKIKSSFQAFNNLFYDTLEYTINNFNYPNAVEVVYDNKLVDKENIYSVNKKILLSDDITYMAYSGAVTEDINTRSDNVFNELLNNTLNRTNIESAAKENAQASGKEEDEIEKIVKKSVQDMRKEIRKSWKKIYFVVTPLCDYVQGKYYNIRVVKGFLLKGDLLKYIDQRSEAIFISPRFKYNNEVYAIVLHFRYFFTSLGPEGFKGLSPLFRVRHELLSEVQSKLARHVNRQGVLFIDED
ncbi:hypothetical protein [Chitinophaga rhizophila]|uniref:Response receiver domain-containing protein n=1 Tax=Chitinophaga rhizophila TaxID=2866212 RepID=A0ABS7GAK9_9BACT|nr:hypothetical protein [Chitinophaga rhizophila]MBW8684693.1 hypothetical protein [Chitinophaga rhizophila]